MITLPFSIIVLSLLSANPYPASFGMDESSFETFNQQIIDSVLSSFSESLKNVVASLTARQDKIEEMSK